jgi:hypothetical protein
MIDMARQDRAISTAMQRRSRGEPGTPAPRGTRNEFTVPAGGHHKEVGRKKKRIILALASGLLIAGAAGAGEIQELPRSLRGRVSIEIARCQPYAGTGDLMEAELRIQTGTTEVRLPDLQCGAYRSGTNQPLFLNPVEGVHRVPAGTILVVRTIFPFDRQHTECRCVVERVRRIEPGEPWREEPDASVWVAPGETTRTERGWVPSSTRVLRRELVLLPSVELRSGPGRHHEVVGEVNASELIEVLGVQGGWKWIQLPARGVEGWVPDDATTPDVEAPVRLAAVLSRLEPHLIPRSSQPTGSGAFCQAVSIGELGELVFALRPETRSVYVTNLWHALPERKRSAFQLYLSDCFGVARIIDMASGDELRNLDWSEDPSLAPGAG